MATYTEDRTVTDSDPVVVREREVVRDVDTDDRRSARRSATLPILLTLLVLIVLSYLFFRYNPFASGKSTNVNVNVPTPTLNR